MACLSERELAERCERQYGRPRTASCPAQTESVSNRRIEPLVHPPSKKKILARETKQGQTTLIRRPPPRTEELADALISMRATLDWDSVPGGLSEDCEVRP